MKKGFGSWTFLLVLFVAASIGFYFGSRDRFKVIAEEVPYKELEKFSKVLQFVESNYVDPVSSEKLIEGAIRGMLQVLDPHSSYLNPEVYREMKVETSGKFGGLGIEVTLKDGYIMVVTPIDETPAYRAGILSGDQIVSIDGKNTKNMTLPEAISVMRGKPGSTINISIMRKGNAKPIDFTLARESIRMQSVRALRLDGDVGYFRISSFMERTVDELTRAYKKMNEPKQLSAMLLDLRGNPGGLLDQAVKVSNFFLEEGPVVYTMGRDKKKRDIEYANKARVVTKLPVVVLVDGSSASASEIVAGALQDYGRAIVAGQPTFGKGSVQTLIPLTDDSGLKLTISKYYTPAGRSIQAKGINPDVLIEQIDPKTLLEAQKNLSQRVKEADLQNHLEIEAKEDSSIVKNEEPVSLSPESNLKKKVSEDYMVAQAMGILKTVAVIQKGAQKPVFELEDREVLSQKGKPLKRNPAEL